MGALGSLPALGQGVIAAGKGAVGAAKAAPGIVRAATQAQLQETAQAGGRAAAMGRQAGGWGMGSSMQALAADLAGQGVLGTQRAQGAQLEAETRQAAAQAGLDFSMFQEQRAQEVLAGETQAINDINALMQNIMLSPRDQWGVAASAQLAPYLNDPGTPLGAKLAALNNMARMNNSYGGSYEDLTPDMKFYYDTVAAMHPEANITMVQETGGKNYTTFAVGEHGG
jgi:hypothetical protein